MGEALCGKDSRLFNPGVFVAYRSRTAWMFGVGRPGGVTGRVFVVGSCVGGAVFSGVGVLLVPLTMGVDGI